MNVNQKSGKGCLQLSFVKYVKPCLPQLGVWAYRQQVWTIRDVLYCSFPGIASEPREKYKNARSSAGAIPGRLATLLLSDRHVTDFPRTAVVISV